MSRAEGSCFADNWLAIREPADHRSRAHGLIAFANAHLRQRGNTRAMTRAITVVDLGAGRGSNLRYLASRLTGPIDWQLLDQDADLLAAAARERRRSACGEDHLSTRIFDLADPLDAVLAGADLVTASALLDLVSRAWIEAFAAACARTGSAVLIALSVNGRIAFSDADSDDAILLGALAHDQVRNKGLGPALGGAAPAVLINALARHGYGVTSQPSDWSLDCADMSLVRPLINGWRDAASQQRPNYAARVADWAVRRIHNIEQDRTRLRVGHIDVLGLPNARLNQSAVLASARRSRS